MFNEGVDVPDTRLVVFLRATGSRTIFEQQLGRGMRKHPGKDVLSVLDFVGNIERLSQIKELVDAITEARIRENGEGEDDVALDDLRSEGIAIRTDHTEFDFDRIVVDLLEKIGSIRDRQNRYVPQSIEEAAVLWRENFADDEPSVSKIEAASKADQFVSFEVIKRLGGMNAFKQTLGFEARIGAQTLEEAAALWRENFGDEEPSSAKVNAASKAGQFISTGTVNKLGGMNALRKLLGYESRVTAQSIEDAAEIWRANFGDEEPSSKKISVASKEGLFMSGPTLLKLGGMNELRRALNFKVEDKREVPTIQSLEEAAQLWRERFGDEEPTVAKINAASKAGQYVSFSFIQKRLGGMDALKTALGVKQEGYSHPTSLEEAATLWRENFGDEEPGQHKINAASKAGKFISAHALSKLGSMDDFKQTLGFGARASAKSIEEAAQLWRANFGDEEPSQAKIKAASKLGKYVSTQTVSRLGGMDALKTALRDI